MGRKRANVSIEIERQEQIERGKRIKYIRENELKLNKTQLAAEIGTSSQFLGLVEEGKDVSTLQDLANQKYLEILYSNPAGFKLTARMTTNYRQLKTIYFQRRTHRLPEWRVFCEWIETLPYADFITKINTDGE